jgi:hypothetical protein
VRRALIHACVLFAGFCAISEGRTSACECGAKPSVAESFAQSSHVFLGVVTTLEPVPSPASSNPGFAERYPSQRVTFRVGQRWKGAAQQQLVLHSLSDCSFPFQLGQAYLVFAGPSFTTVTDGQAKTHRFLRFSRWHWS